MFRCKVRGLNNDTVACEQSSSSYSRFDGDAKRISTPSPHVSSCFTRRLRLRSFYMNNQTIVLKYERRWSSAVRTTETPIWMGSINPAKFSTHSSIPNIQQHTLRQQYNVSDLHLNLRETYCANGSMEILNLQHVRTSNRWAV